MRVLAAVVCLALVVIAGPARAGPCPDAVRAWAAAAARDVGVPVTAAACYHDLVRVRLAPPGAPPLDVEVAEPPGPAFRRAGRLRLSPVLEVADFRTVAAPRREAFERFAAWVAAHEREVVTGAGAAVAVRAWVPARVAGSRAPWCLALALALLAAARWRARPLPRADLALAAALAGGALALRLALGAWGPFHVNGQGPLWLAGAARDPRALLHYGPGFAEFPGVVARLPGVAPDVAVFAATAVASALVPPLAFALGRAWGLDRPRAALAAAALALDPVALRHAATESYFPTLAALALGAAVALVAAGAEPARRARAALLALGGALLAAQAARTHPVAWPVVALAPLAVLAPEAPLRARLARTAAAVALVAAVVAAASGGVVAALLADVRAAAVARPRAPDLPVLLAWTAALGAAWRYGAARRWAVAVAALHLAVALATRHGFTQSLAWQQSYDRLYAVPVVLAAAAFVPARAVRDPVRLALAAGAAGALVLALAWPLVRARTTDHAEYAWLRPRLARLPPGCRVVHVGAAGPRRTLFLATYLGPPRPPGAFVHVDARAPFDLAAALGAPGCTYYVRTSLCAGADARHACDAVERRLALAPVARATLPARPSDEGLGYATPRVEVVVARVTAIR